MCKNGDIFSLAVLIDRGLDLTSKRITRSQYDASTVTTGSHIRKSSLFSFQGMILKIVGVDGGEGTPVPIPNTAVKLTCADNTWLVAAREDRKAPTQTKLRRLLVGVFVL